MRVPDQLIWWSNELGEGKPLGSADLSPGNALIIGRGLRSDIVLRDKFASRRHARIDFSENQIVVTDLKSGNGTLLDGKPITQAALLPGAILAIGSYRFRIASGVRPDVARRGSDSAVAGETRFILSWSRPDGRNRGKSFRLDLRAGVVLVVGRGMANDIVVNDPRVSKSHASISVRQGVVIVQDLRSGNGTYLDDREIETGAWKPGQVVRMGSTCFSLEQLDFVTAPLEPEDAGMSRLPKGTAPRRSWRMSWTFQDPSGAGDAFSRILEAGKQIVVGRSRKADLILDHTSVSRFHLRMEPGEAGIFVEDLQSANGTYIDDAKVTAATWRTGQTLGIGAFRFSLEPRRARRRRSAEASPR
jgi:pSer/pThr/pTyr-binding forkhead associated (FHA) protein